MLRLRPLPLIILAVAYVSMGQSSRFTEVIHPSLPPFEFRVHVDDKQQALANGFSAIDSIGIESAGKPLQTLSFSGDDVPIINGPWRNAISLRDVDCDGYKDLLVRLTIGIHGDSWYHLYRFNQTSHLFVEYPRFSTLPLQKVDCRINLLTTYVNSGAAGCVYESGKYRWVDGELFPVRIESQEIADGGFNRIIRSWTKGKEVDIKQHIEGDDCHRANQRTAPSL